MRFVAALSCPCQRPPACDVSVAQASQAIDSSHRHANWTLLRREAGMCSFSTAVQTLALRRAVRGLRVAGQQTSEE